MVWLLIITLSSKCFLVIIRSVIISISIITVVVAAAIALIVPSWCYVVAVNHNVHE